MDKTASSRGISTKVTHKTPNFIDPKTRISCILTKKGRISSSCESGANTSDTNKDCIVLAKQSPTLKQFFLGNALKNMDQRGLSLNPRDSQIDLQKQRDSIQNIPDFFLMI
ncbi:hypothetical protein U2P60_09740 [Brucella sp. H1_1004]|uniref:hypothetical protein n=1 Tax=Brucella sp. H1_1004 TaxID=3110109 RepID=UPI0039B3A11A